ncbi:hypothetical protein PR002_g20900 [Phytophthora rubi]|uniref:Uncharacterized protein n=1 Tax=Phytophthora rubi TaxID=129364 RepID=A0A6A3JFQ0_9STRA|nr:hypothetical protein PR002_g20900 [Phytophthora rubi]
MVEDADEEEGTRILDDVDFVWEEQANRRATDEQQPSWESARRKPKSKSTGQQIPRSGLS